MSDTPEQGTTAGETAPRQYDGVGEATPGQYEGAGETTAVQFQGAGETTAVQFQGVGDTAPRQYDGAGETTTGQYPGEPQQSPSEPSQPAQSALGGEIARAAAPAAGSAAPAAAEVETIVGDDTVTIHRAPRYLRFMIAGGVVGLVVALILTFSFPEPAGFDFSQVFGFLALFCGVVGFALGAVAALLVDRASRRAAKTIVVERVEGGEDPDPDPQTPSV